MKKGYRKLAVVFFSLIGSALLAWIFQNNTAVLIPLFTFWGTVVGGYFTANWAVHKSQNNNNQGDYPL